MAEMAIKQYGVSTATSRGGFGEHPIYEQLEEEACAFFDCEKVIYFASGYMGPSILMQTVCYPQDHIFIDSVAHYSLWDAAQITNKTITPFRHNDPEHLRNCIRNELLADERPVILTDGIFPISGEIARLPEYLEIIEPYAGRLCVDDAHAAGVLGAHGRGSLEYFGIKDERCLATATLAKALGGFGGIIGGKTNWINYVERKSTICAGASPPPLVVAAASSAGLEIARSAPALRMNLWENVKQARNGFRQLGWDMEDTPSPIICLQDRVGDHLQHVQSGLLERGIAVEFVRSYTSTPAGGALRIAIFATHTKKQIDRLLENVEQLIKREE